MKIYFSILLTAIFFTLGCGNNKLEEKEKQTVADKPQAKEPNMATPVTLSADEYDGMKLFMKNCNKCHPGGEKGRGPSLNDKALPNFLIHWQVRLGGGKMPKFTDEQISKEELRKITAFVKLMQKMSLDK